MITPLLLPFFHGFGGNTLRTELRPRHVVWRVDEKEQRESKHIDADQHEYAIDQAADEVTGHDTPPATAVRRSRRR